MRWSQSWCSNKELIEVILTKKEGVNKFEDGNWKDNVDCCHCVRLEANEEF